MEKNPLVIVIDRSESASTKSDLNKGFSTNRTGLPFLILRKINRVLQWEIPPILLLIFVLSPMVLIIAMSFTLLEETEDNVDRGNSIEQRTHDQPEPTNNAIEQDILGESEASAPKESLPLQIADTKTFLKEAEQLNKRTDTEVKASYVEEVQEYVTFTRTALWLIESGLSGSYDRSEDTEIYLTGVRNIGTACLFKYKYSLEEIPNEEVRERIVQIEELSEHFCPEIVETADSLLAYWNEEDVVKKSEYFFNADEVGMSAYKKQYLMLQLCNEVEWEMGW